MLPLLLQLPLQLQHPLLLQLLHLLLLHAVARFAAFMLLLGPGQLRDDLGVNQAAAPDDDAAVVRERLDLAECLALERVRKATVISNPRCVNQDKLGRVDLDELAGQVVGDGADEVVLADLEGAAGCGSDRQFRSVVEKSGDFSALCDG